MEVMWYGSVIWSCIMVWLYGSEVWHGYDHNTCYLEDFLANTIVILYAAHYVIDCCCSMLFAYCM